MNRVLPVFALVLTLFGAGVVARQRPQAGTPPPAPAAPAPRRAVNPEEKPIAAPKEFQDLMKANAAINPDGGGGSLNQNLAEGAENYQGIVKDAAALKANFAKLRAMLTELDLREALPWVQAGEESISTIERFAADSVWQQGGDERALVANVREIQRAQIALTDSCRSCHLKHRVYVIATPIRFEIAR